MHHEEKTKIGGPWMKVHKPWWCIGGTNIKSCFTTSGS